MLSSDIEAFKAMAVKRQMEWLTDKQEERHEGEILTSLTAGLADVIWTASRRTTDKRPRKNENASSACNHPYPFQLCSRRRREGGVGTRKVPFLQQYLNAMSAMTAPSPVRRPYKFNLRYSFPERQIVERGPTSFRLISKGREMAGGRIKHKHACA